MTLEAFFQEHPRAALAFSRGVDSAYLLYASRRWGAEVQAYYVQTAFQPRFERADVIVCVSPSYWADVPGQFKAFIDRCTPWCNTHEPHATLSGGKRGYAIALRTGPGMPECQRVMSSIEHFYGRLEIERCGSLGLCSVEYREAVEPRRAEIVRFCESF